jgi:hypothetical protein
MGSGIYDWQVWLSYTFVLICGVLIGYDLSTDSLNSINLPAWLSAIATSLAVITALYTTKLNINRDTYRLVCKAVYESKVLLSFDEINFVQVRGLDINYTVRATNTGLRPIAIDYLMIKHPSGSWVEQEVSKIDDNGFSSHPVINPGCFLDWKLSKKHHGDDDKIARQIEVFVVDAAGVKHKADTTHKSFIRPAVGKYEG